MRPHHLSAAQSEDGAEHGESVGTRRRVQRRPQVPGWAVRRLAARVTAAAPAATTRSGNTGRGVGSSTTDE